MIGARAGDNDQVIALAEALGLPFEVKHLEYNPLCHLGPRLLGRSLASLTVNSRVELRGEPPPDLTISTGHRSVPAVLALRRRSRGSTRSVHVGFPRISPAKFDLVIATPQYPIADHPNLLRIPYALTRAATAVADPTDAAVLNALPRPRRLLIVGGPTLFWNLDQPRLIQTLANMIDEAAAEGGSVVVTTSARTPRRVQQQISHALAAVDVPTLLVTPGEAPAYASLLAAADSIRVTADSVSMASDAIWAGKPMGLVPIEKSGSGRWVIGATDWMRRPLYPQDLRLFWRSLAEIGIGEEPAMPSTSTSKVLSDVVDRVLAVIRR